jgi:microcystin-dependent protein
MDNSSYNVAPNARDVPPENGGGLPVGTVIHFASATPPDGYLLCDGSFVKKGDYPDLFAVIGTTWGLGDATPLAFLSTSSTGSAVQEYINFTSIPSYYTPGTVFTMTGGRSGYSGYIWTVVSININQMTASATSGGAQVFFPGGTDNTPGTVTITTPLYFTIPNTSGKTIRGIASVTYTLAATGGADLKQITSANLPPHRHSAAAPGPITINSSGSTAVSGYFFNFGTQYTSANATYQENGTTLVANTAVDTTNVWVGIPMIIRAF